MLANPVASESVTSVTGTDGAAARAPISVGTHGGGTRRCFAHRQGLRWQWPGKAAATWVRPTEFRFALRPDPARRQSVANRFGG